MSVEKLRQVFSQTLGLPLERVTDDLEYNKVKEWDSVAHMAMIAAIEQAFDILIDTDDIIDMSSFKKAQAIIAKYGVK